MKIKSIATICKKNKQVVLFNRYSDSGTISQYIGDGSAHCGSRPYNPENPDAPCSAQSKKAGRRGGGIGRLRDPHSGLLRERRN